MSTVFDKIISGEIPTKFLYQNEAIVAFPDIRPLAPVHVLIIPKKPIVSIDTAEDIDQALLGRMILVARDIARDLHIADKGYKLLFRVGRDGGQEIPHIHLHLIGGARLTEGIGPVKNHKS